MPFPKEFPVDAVAVVTKAIRTSTYDVAFAEAAYDVIGYGAGLALGSGKPVVGASRAAATFGIETVVADGQEVIVQVPVEFGSLDEVADALDDLAAKPTLGATYGEVDSGQVLPIVIALGNLLVKLLPLIIGKPKG
jgi:hypothetical protein